MTTKEAANYLGCSRRQILVWIHRGEIANFEKQGRQYFIPKSQMELMKSKKENSSVNERSRSRVRATLKRVDSLCRHPIVSGLCVVAVVTLVALTVRYIRQGPPPVMGAQLEDVKISNPQITMQEFLVSYFDLRDIPTGDHDALRDALSGQGISSDLEDDVLGAIGVVVSYEIVFDGLSGEQCLMSWSVYDATSRQPVPDGYLRDQPAFPHGAIIPTAHQDRISDFAWIPRPPRPGPFFVELVLKLDDNSLESMPLDIENSDFFA